MSRHRKSFAEMSFIEVGELVLKNAGNWRGAAIIELAQYQIEEQDTHDLVRALNAMWWGTSPEDVIDELLQNTFFPDDNVIPENRFDKLGVVYS
jgi:hypothetical protein